MHAAPHAHGRMKKDDDKSLYSDISSLEPARSGSRLLSAIHLKAQDIVDLSAEEWMSSCRKLGSTWT